jgi:hypothetical protein
LLDIKALDRNLEKQALENLKKGEVPEYIVGTATDFYGDSEKVKCDKCGCELVLRPWMKKIANEVGVPVYCIKCARNDKSFSASLEEATRAVDGVVKEK